MAVKGHRGTHRGEKFSLHGTNAFLKEQRAYQLKIKQKIIRGPFTPYQMAESFQ